MQRSPGGTGGGSADWGNIGGGGGGLGGDGGIQSITFSLGGNGGGGGIGPHCSPIEDKDDTVDNETLLIKTKKKDNDEVSTADALFLAARGGIGGATAALDKKSGLMSPPPEMLDMVTPEGEAAAEEAGGNKRVREAAKKAARFVAETAAAEGGDGDGSDDGKELTNELSSGSSNLGINEDPSEGLHAEDSGALEQKMQKKKDGDDADVQT